MRIKKMKLWLIALLAVGILGLGGIVMAASSGFNDTTENKETTTTGGSYEAKQASNEYQDCNAQSNCGLETCEVVQGTGSCGCGN